MIQKIKKVIKYNWRLLTFLSILLSLLESSDAAAWRKILSPCLIIIYFIFAYNIELNDTENKNVL